MTEYFLRKNRLWDSNVIHDPSNTKKNVIHECYHNYGKNKLLRSIPDVCNLNDVAKLSHNLSDVSNF